VLFNFGIQAQTGAPVVDHGLAAPPRSALHCPHRSLQRVDGPLPNPDSPIATAALIPSSPGDFATASRPFSSQSSSVEMRIRFAPVTNGLRNSPTGSKGHYVKVLATRLVIASTGAMLTVGHEAPCRISALACRIESRDHTGKEGNSRQVSGTGDASKTQLRLTRSPSINCPLRERP
jgi:hypothetical protein